MSRYKTLTLLSILLILSLLMAACGGTAGEATEPPAGGAEATQPPAGEATQPPAGEATQPPAAGGAVSVMGVWGGEEFDKFAASVEPFTEQTGIQMSFETTPELATVLVTRVEAGNPPELAILPNPGIMHELVASGDLIPLNEFLSPEELQERYSQDWIDLATVNGQVYGVWFKGAVKSLVWYNPKAFQARGYEVPETWEELNALEEQIIADGGTPWCIGLESGSASGWPGTDWIEDIMLRTADPETYDRWVNHEIEWTDPAVRRAWETWGEIARNEQMVWGGTTAELTTGFGDAPRPMFDDPPGCYLHKQASFITTFFPEGLTPGEDYDFFPFPAIDEQYGVPALGAGDVVVMLRDTPQARELMRYLSTAQPAEVWASLGGFVSPNQAVNLEAYPDELTRKQAQFLREADTFRFDGSDLMPPSVGAGSFWRGVMDFVAGSDLDSVLQTIEESADQAYEQ